MNEISGIYVPTAVPFHADGSINDTELKRYLQWLADCGVHGIFANGSTGEFTRLTCEERRRVIEITAAAVGGKLNIIAGAVEATERETLAACKHYSDLGCQAVALCPPPYFKMDQETLLEHYRRLADQSALPLLLYNIPAFAPAMTWRTITTLAQHPRIVGLKDSSRDFPGFLNLIQIIKSVRPQFVLMTGTEEILLPALMMGADGGTIATAGIVPEAIMALYRGARAGDFAAAEKLQYSLLPLIRTMFSMDFPTGFRAAMELRGFHPGPERQSLSQRQQQLRTELIADMRPQVDSILAMAKASKI